MLLGLAMVLSVITWPSIASAQSTVQKFVSVMVTPLELDLGSLPGTPEHDAPGTLQVRLAANCLNAGVTVSLSPLTGPGGVQIDPSRILVKRQGQSTFRPLSTPVNVTDSMTPGIVNFELQFRILSQGMDPAGEYTGTLTITSAPLP